MSDFFTMFDDFDFPQNSNAPWNSQQQNRSGATYTGDVTLTFMEAVNGTTRVFNVGNNTVTVRIPKGVEDGASVVVKNKGGHSQTGGLQGDLNLTVHVQPHSQFKREALDIHVDVPITFADAVSGGVVSVPTLDKPNKIRIPEGTQSGASFKLSKKGIATKSKIGNLYAHISIIVPTTLTTEEQAILQNMLNM